MAHEHYTNAHLTLTQATGDPTGSVRWQSPSNIALVKYWGKHGRQLPRNPSVSLTLQEARSETRIAYRPARQRSRGVDLKFYFEGSERPDFGERIAQYLGSIVDVYPFLEEVELEIHSSNTFPHSAGIASSASAMSAIATALCDMERRLFATLTDEVTFNKKASYLSRLGSGSACRSVYPVAAAWGATEAVPSSSDLYAVPVGEVIDPVFESYHDDILIVSRAEKSVSSSAGHRLMEGNAYATPRYLQADERLHRLMDAMKAGDLETFGELTEQEALTLHALMMTSDPAYVLMEPDSLRCIQIVQAWRRDTHKPLYFTLDAGPNLHLLYPDSIAEEVSQLIDSELRQYCNRGEVIRDRVGQGSSPY